MALRSNRRPFISMKFRKYAEKYVHCNPFCKFSAIFSIAPLNMLMSENQSLLGLHVLLKILMKVKTVESRSLSLIFVI